MPLCVNLCGRYDLYMYLCCTCVCVSVCSDMCILCTVTCVPILVHCILFFCVYGQFLLGYSYYCLACGDSLVALSGRDWNCKCSILA